MKRTLLIVEFLLLTLAPVLAMGEVSSSELLRRVEKHYSCADAFIILFSQQTTSMAGTAMATEASGRLFYQRPRKMRWEYEKPEAQVFVLSDSRAWLYVPGDCQITVFGERDFFCSPVIRSLFDDILALEKHFLVRLKAKSSNKDTFLLELVPRSENYNIRSVELWVDSKCYRIVSLQTRDVLGNTNRIYFELEKAVSNVSDKFFQFQVPPSTLVIDSRGRVLSEKEILQFQKEVNKEL